MCMYMYIYKILYLLHFSCRLWIDGKRRTALCYYHLLDVYNLFDKERTTLWPCICTLSWCKNTLSWHLESLTGVYSVSRGCPARLEEHMFGFCPLFCTMPECSSLLCTLRMCPRAEARMSGDVYTHKILLTPNRSHQGTWIQGGKADPVSLPSPSSWPETHFFTYPNGMLHEGHKLAIHQRNTNSARTYIIRIYSTC